MHSIKVFRIVFKYHCCVKTFLKSESVGVEKEQIKGTTNIRLFPFNKIGKIKR